MPKTKMISFRVTAEEHAIFERASRGDLSSWARTVLLQAAEQGITSRNVTLANLWTEIRAQRILLGHMASKPLPLGTSEQVKALIDGALEKAKEL